MTHRQLKCELHSTSPQNRAARDFGCLVPSPVWDGHRIKVFTFDVICTAEVWLHWVLLLLSSFLLHPSEMRSSVLCPALFHLRLPCDLLLFLFSRTEDQTQHRAQVPSETELSALCLSHRRLLEAHELFDPIGYSCGICLGMKYALSLSPTLLRDLGLHR